MNDKQPAMTARLCIEQWRARHVRRAARAITAAAALLMLAACSLPPHADRPVAVRTQAGAAATIDEVLQQMARADVVLLGEVHDHPAVHATRHRLLRSFVERVSAGGANPPRLTLAMEHFDIDRQQALDAARLASPGDPQAWIAAGAPPARTGTGGGGWPWTLLQPMLDLARERQVPLRAANVSRTQLRELIASATGSTASTPSVLTEEARGRLRGALDAGHCGMLKGEQLQPMAVAQELRDRRMAEVLLSARAGPGSTVVLLAGNGHVRRDFGVPAHLAREPGVRSLSVGFIERESLDEAIGSRAYDFIFVFAAHAREDPCAGLRRSLAPAKPG